METASFTQAAKQDQTRRLSNAILRRTLVNVVLFAVVYFVLFMGFMATFGTMVSDFIFDLVLSSHTVHGSLQTLFFVLVITGFVLGVVLIVRSGINRALRYFDLLLDSTSDVLAKREGPIILPSELAPTALFLNGIKTQGEQNERAAKAAEERKNELVVYLAHDIKTPLTSIIGYLTLLDESPSLPLDVRARYTGITLAKAYRLEELLDEFFEITRYNLQAIPIERSRFDGALFVSQVVDEFYPVAEGRSLELVFEGPDELPVFADAGRVARVLNNVLKNAVAYADTGTRVNVRTGLACGQDGFVWWELTVTDRGRELSSEHLERIFEKFFRADASRGSGSGGAGLGLAIAREIARAHGGDIYATSDAGLTSFTIWIPQGPSVTPVQP
ncbi:MAG: HAMP domain-containing sensor histidine kinase [Gordonibacter sp.]|uniref:sensor histidine kinase n=1 Tax=Gordonibacter sp. TaxID=1968902 RepID=UPI002FCB2E12